MRFKANSRTFYQLSVCFILLGLLFYVNYPVLFGPLQKMGGADDWNMFRDYYSLLFYSVRVAHTLPMWSYPITWPYTGAFSEDVLRNAWSPVLSAAMPLFPFLNDSIADLFKALFAVYLFVGASGYVALATRLGLGAIPVLIGGLIFLGCDWHMAHFSVGHATFLTAMLWPWAVVGFDWALTNKRPHAGWRLFLSASPIALMFFEGGGHILVFSALILGTWWAYRAFCHRQLYLVRVFGYCISILGLSFVRLLPMVLQNQGHVSEHRGDGFVSTYALLNNFFWRPFNFPPGFPGPYEYSCYVGMGGLVFLILMPFVKRAWPFLIMACVYVPFYLVPHFFENVLIKLPFLRAEGVLSRFTLISVFFFSLGAAAVISEIQNTLRQRIQFRKFAFLFCVVILASVYAWDLRSQSDNAWNRFFTIDLDTGNSLAKQDEYGQNSVDAMRRQTDFNPNRRIVASSAERDALMALSRGWSVKSENPDGSWELRYFNRTVIPSLAIQLVLCFGILFGPRWILALRSRLRSRATS